MFLPKRSQHSPFALPLTEVHTRSNSADISKQMLSVLTGIQHLARCCQGLPKVFRLGCFSLKCTQKANSSMCLTAIPLDPGRRDFMPCSCCASVPRILRLGCFKLKCMLNLSSIAHASQFDQNWVKLCAFLPWPDGVIVVSDGSIAYTQTQTL